MTSKPFTISWPCLADSQPTKIVPNPKPTTQKTFAQALSKVCDIPHSQLPKPSIKGRETSIEIPEEEYEERLDTCKNNLHARIIWPKGTTRLTIVYLRAKLKTVWSSLGRWGVTSLGKGYYEFSFSSIEDARFVRSSGSWNLKPGLLKFFTWTYDFNPNTQKNTSAQVWLRIYGLGQEYWRPKILFDISISVGSPICTDESTSKCRLLE